MKKWAPFAYLACKRFREHAVLGAHILVEKPRQDAVIVDKRSEPLRDLTISRVEELRKHHLDCLLLRFDMSTQLPVDVGDQRSAYILKPRLLSL